MTAASLDEFPELAGQAAPPRPSLWEFVQDSGLQCLVICASKNPNSKITILLVSPSTGQALLAVKVPTTDVAARAVEAEGRMLVDLRRRMPGAIETIPAVVDMVDFDGRPGIVTSAVQGTPMTTAYLRWRHTARPQTVAADFATVDRWLTALHQGTAAERAPLDMDGGVVARLTSRFGNDVDSEDTLARLADVHARLQENVTPRTAVHGDLWFGNVLVSQGQASGVVDWEAGATSGEPVRDVVRFALMYALFLDRRTRAGRSVAGHQGLRAGRWGAGVEYALDANGWFPDLFRRFVRESLSRLGASPDSWRDAALAGIAEVAAFADHEEFAHLHLELFRRLVLKWGSL